jgi:DNA-binding GntR family transcriptional regulator
LAYKQLAGELRDAVLASEFPRGSQLPTEADLVTRYGVSRQTVRRAFAELVAEGLVYRVAGRGTFATPRRRGAYLRSHGSIHELLALSVDTELEVVRPVERRSDLDAAGRLQLESDEVFSMMIRRLHQGVPFALSTVSLPVAVGLEAGVEAFMSAGARTATTIIGLVDESPSGPIAGAHQSTTVVTISSDLAPLIDCTPGQAVLRIDRLYYNRDGVPVELAINHFNPDRYSYRLELRR